MTNFHCITTFAIYRYLTMITVLPYIFIYTVITIFDYGYILQYLLYTLITIFDYVYCTTIFVIYSNQLSSNAFKLTPNFVLPVMNFAYSLITLPVEFFDLFLYKNVYPRFSSSKSDKSNANVKCCFVDSGVFCLKMFQLINI